MGMYDEIWWEAELPSSQPSTSRLFQTKSFDRCLDRYIVTQEGKPRLVGNAWQNGPFQGQSDPGSVDVDFHGDIWLLSTERPSQEYVARFTHGRLEWIRLSSDVPPVRRNLIPPQSNE